MCTNTQINTHANAANTPNTHQTGPDTINFPETARLIYEVADKLDRDTVVASRGNYQETTDD